MWNTWMNGIVTQNNVHTQNFLIQVKYCNSIIFLVNKQNKTSIQASIHNGKLNNDLQIELLGMILWKI